MCPVAHSSEVYPYRKSVTQGDCNAPIYMHTRRTHAYGHTRSPQHALASASTVVDTHAVARLAKLHAHVQSHNANANGLCHLGQEVWGAKKPSGQRRTHGKADHCFSDPHKNIYIYQLIPAAGWL